MLCLCVFVIQWVCWSFFVGIWILAFCRWIKLWIWMQCTSEGICMLWVVSMVTTIIVGVDIRTHDNDHIIKEYFYDMKKYVDEYSMCSCLPTHSCSLVHQMTSLDSHMSHFLCENVFHFTWFIPCLEPFLSLHTLLCLNFGHKLKVKIAMQHAIQHMPIIQEHVTYSQVVHVDFFIKINKFSK